VRSEPTETLAAAARLGVAPRVTSFAPELLEGCDVLISTLPGGAADPLAAACGAVPVLLDVVYDPWPTPLATAVGQAGEWSSTAPRCCSTRPRRRSSS
jgi:shikimate dehydrogenase